MSPLNKLARDTANKLRCYRINDHSEAIDREHAQKEILQALTAAHNLGVQRECKRITAVIKET